MYLFNKIKLVIFVLFFWSVTVWAQQGNYIFQPSGSNFIVYNRGGQNFYIHHNKLIRWKIMGNMKKLSSGKRIVNAGDDPSGLAVSEKMNAIVNQLNREAMNLQDYRNYLRYYDGVIAQDVNALKRIRELILRSSSGILGPDDRAINQSEIDQFLRQIDMNARFSTFNKKQVIPQLTVKELGLEKVNVVRNLYGSMKLVDGAIDKLLRMRGKAGAMDNVYTMRIKGKLTHMVNLQLSESRISDLDMAEEITSLMKNNVLYRANMGVLIQGKK